jgi:hypothetical protein
MAFSISTTVVMGLIYFVLPIISRLLFGFGAHVFPPAPLVLA